MMPAGAGSWLPGDLGCPKNAAKLLELCRDNDDLDHI